MKLQIKYNDVKCKAPGTYKLWGILKMRLHECNACRNKECNSSAGYYYDNILPDVAAMVKS